MKRNALPICSILLLIILISSCVKTGVKDDSSYEDVITSTQNGELKITATAEDSVPVLPFVTVTPIPDIYEVEMTTELPPLFQEGFQKADLTTSSPISVQYCENTEQEIWRGDYIFAAAAQFPTLVDEISIDDLQSLWSGELDLDGQFSQLLIPEDYVNVFSDRWGEMNSEDVFIIPEDQLVKELWKHQDRIALIPFHLVEPRMKVLNVETLNPMFKSFDAELYPLTFSYCLYTEEDSEQLMEKISAMPISNRDESKLTTLLMTGVTALTRETAYKMIQNGVLYPAEQVQMWFEEADLVHISNEVSFTDQCPVPEPPFSASRFCSRTEYYELLESIGANVIELTGNHLLDYGEDSFQEMMDLFHQDGLEYFGGGVDIDDANQPLKISHNGNEFVFVGCNVPGPESVFADENSGGANPCNIDQMAGEISEFTAEGNLVVAGIQHYEACQIEPMSAQRVDFQQLAEAGAVIVSGSQAHCAQGMTFVEDRFIHYGLGNLFFDQMWDYYRNAFMDYHVFYDGQYLGVQLLTTRLEDASQPRPMTEKEREEFLELIFSESNWGME